MATFCFECKREMGTFEARANKKMIISRGGFQPENMGENDVLCDDCLEPIRKSMEPIKTSQQKDSKERPTRLLYLVPIFMGLLGGILMYIAVKDQNQEMANDGMFLGMCITILGVFLYFVIIYIGVLNIPNLIPIPI